MMQWIALTIVLASSNVAPSIVVLGFSDAKLDAESLALLDELLVTGVQTRLPGVRVVSPSDLEAILGIEMAKDALGCEDSTCAAEIGGALGADYLLTGRSGELGDSWFLVLKLIDLDTFEVLERQSTSVSSGQPEGYPGAIESLVEEIRLENHVLGLDANEADELPSLAEGSKKDAPEAMPANVLEQVTPPLPARDSLAKDSLALLVVGAAGLVIAGSLAFDLRADSSKDGTLDGVDFLPVAGYTAGGIAMLWALATEELF